MPISQEGHPRTFKEMCAVVTEASKKDIGRCYNFIVKELEQVCGIITIIIKVFCDTSYYDK